MKLANYGLKPLTGESIYFSILDSSQTFIFNNSSKNCLLCRSQCLSRFLFKIPELDNRILLAYLPFIKVLHHWLSIGETSATSPFSLTSSLSRSITVLSSTSIESSTFPFLMYFRDQLWDRISTIFFIHSVNKTWTVRIAS